MEDDDSDYDYENYWAYLTDPILLNIFEYLSTLDIVNAGTTCKNWNRVSHDDVLWKHQFRKTFSINPSVGIKPGRTSWYEEFQRLIYHAPSVETEVLKSHNGPVLHVTFSHNGKYFVTCSFDGFVQVWNSSYPADLKYSYDMKPFSWKFTQYAEFNEFDSLLLVSGNHFGKDDDMSGEIAVFSLGDEMELLCRILNKPYDVFGTFYSEEHIISGEIRQISTAFYSSYIWIYKAYPDITSEKKPLMSRLFRFINVNARNILVATCKSDVSDGENQTSPILPNPSNTDTKKPVDANTLDDNFRKKAISENRKFGSKPRFMYNEDYKSTELNPDSSDSETLKTESTYESEASSSEDDFDIDSDEDLTSQPEKYLIFTTGSKTTTPHQIGIKKIGIVSFPKKLDPGPSLAERIAERKERAQRPPVSLEDINMDDLSKQFDSLDYLIELHGHIIGMKLSPDHRYLYVNCRPWPEGYVISNPLDPPPVAQEIDIHVIDLSTFKEVGVMLRAHRAYTPSDECFLIFLDVCNDYIASGSEDKHGYLWDRHYGIGLTKFPHSDVVNGVAFNPKDSEMLVTVSDDHLIKIWRSRAKTVEFFDGKTQYPRAIKLSPKRSSIEKRTRNCF